MPSKNPGMRCIRLTVTPEQLECLLSRIETAFVMAMEAVPIRGISLARAALQARPYEDSFDAAQLAPVYAELLRFSPCAGLASSGMAGGEQVKWGRRHRAKLRRLAGTL